LPRRGAIWVQLSRRPALFALYDFLPDEHLSEVQNLHDFAGMLVFDKWTCNSNGRQTLFFPDPRDSESGYDRTPGSMEADPATRRYRTVMIDQGCDSFLDPTMACPRL
jgi:hypothetical protein